MKTIVIESIVAMLTTKVLNTKKLVEVLHSFTYKELNNLADCLVSDDQADHTRAETVITARAANIVLTH
jgi:hypothetical protein